MYISAVGEPTLIIPPEVFFCKLKQCLSLIHISYEDLTRDGFIETVSGKGSFVASPNKEFIQEEQLRIAEELLEKVAIIGRTPVSYTHLDVYKRQFLYRGRYIIVTK